MYAYRSLKHFWFTKLLSHMKGTHAYIMLFAKTLLLFSSIFDIFPEVNRAEMSLKINVC